jgi:hypothetical protein
VTLTEWVCETCGLMVEEDHDYTYCPDCGDEEPWIEQDKYTFDEDDLPYVFSYHVYNDTWGLWHAFCQAYFGTRLEGDHIANLPSGFPRLKYIDTDLYFVITEDLDLKGPYVDEESARNA